MDKPSLVIGNIVKGKDLWDRQFEIDNIWSALKNTCVLLKAPRRFGKSSIMYNLYEKPRDGVKVFFYDTEGLKSPEEFISRIMAGLLAETKMAGVFSSTLNWLKGLKDIVGKVDEFEFSFGKINVEETGLPGLGLPEVRLKLKEALKAQWQEAGSRLMNDLSRYNGRILFCIDELPILIKRIAKESGNQAAQDFLNWFRGIRINQKLSHVRWVVGGSIGIEHVLENIGSGTASINDFKVERIEPFSPDDGRNFIKALFAGKEEFREIPDDTVNRLMEVIGPPIPYFIQILVSECIYQSQRLKKDIDADIIDRAYREGLLGPASRTYFEHYFSRLKEYYDGETEKVVKRLILEVARKEPVAKEELFKLFLTESKGDKGDLPGSKFSHIMGDIENDFYVTYDFDTKSYSFFTKILKDWWLRYYDQVEM